MLFFRNPEKKQNPSSQQQIQQQCRDEASNPFLPFLLQKVNCRKRTEHEYKYQPEQSKQAGAYSGGYPFSISGDIRSLPS